MNIRELLEFHTRFKTPGGLFAQYVSAVRDTHLFSGVTAQGNIATTDTHKKLIAQAQRQNILHQTVGYSRALQLAPNVHFYDVGLRAIDGRVFARGTALSLDEAVARAFGELYERVSMRFVPVGQQVVHASYKKLQEQKESVFPIFELAQTTKKQKETFTDLVWDEDSVFGWVQATNIFTQAPTWVPAQLLHWGYKRQKGEPLLGEMNTNGLGAGYTYGEAVLSGASELLQRHSFFTHWYAKKAPPKIALHSVLQSPLAQQGTKTLLRAVSAYDFTAHLLDCTLVDGTPSVAAVLTKPGLGWFVGMATKVDYCGAVERAVCEALSVYTWAMDGANNTQAPVLSETTLTAGFCDRSITDVKRIHAWSQAHIAKNGELFLAGREVLFDDLLKKKANHPVDVLKVLAKGQLCVVQAKQPYLDEVGFHSVRLLAPGLYKLALHERFSTPVLGGVEPTNTYPHPFP